MRRVISGHGGCCPSTCENWTPDGVSLIPTHQYIQRQVSLVRGSLDLGPSGSQGMALVKSLSRHTAEGPGFPAPLTKPCLWTGPCPWPPRAGAVGMEGSLPVSPRGSRLGGGAGSSTSIPVPLPACPMPVTRGVGGQLESKVTDSPHEDRICSAATYPGCIPWRERPVEGITAAQKGIYGINI